ncbi:hypothetical protein A4A49_53150 [Nicotiana attenuata]|uniref:Uncharacterized protein n=1 Tax=Nicotiana attenuata TaxID=49451 RepID=A0A314KXX8_NICAT|nr:hypothetical protein A4A49_53150 [Nicotiana attenuata]
MANNEESNPLLSPEVKDELKKPNNKPIISSAASAIPATFPMRWNADGLPMGHGVVGVTNRAQWDFGLCACFGRNDEFCSSDIEVCVDSRFRFVILVFRSKDCCFV